MKLITRKAWGARPAKVRPSPLGSTRGVKVHYTGDHVNPIIVAHHNRCQ